MWIVQGLVMELQCKRCGSEAYVKNGLMRGQQRYLCKGCGLNFTNTPTRGKPLALKADLLQRWGRAEKAPWQGPDQAAIPNRLATKVA